MFAYTAARQNPNKLYLGLDANARPLEKLSEKTHRGARKGGAANLLFIESAVENLPNELDGVASEVHVNFPWGSLLRAVATGDAVLREVRRVCSTSATLHVVTGLDPVRDAAEIARLGLPLLTIDYIDHTLAGLYLCAGFEIVDHRMLSATECREIPSSWARRLHGASGRALCYWIAKATETPSS